jgi:hypothetical protein
MFLLLERSALAADEAFTRTAFSQNWGRVYTCTATLPLPLVIRGGHIDGTKTGVASFMFWTVTTRKLRC